MLFLEPSRAASTVLNSIVCLIALVVLAADDLYGGSEWPQQWRFHPDPSDRVRLIAAGVAAFLAVATVLAAFFDGRRWRIARKIERWSKNPALAALVPDASPAIPRAIAPIITPPAVVFRAARKLPKPQSVRPVTSAANIIGMRPLHIGYLRLFDNQPRSRTFIQGAWREFGWVHMLRSATSITPREYRAARGDLARFFISTPSELMTRMRSSARPPLPRGRRTFRDLSATTIRTKDKFGSYPTDAFLCHGAFWKQAVDIMLGSVDLVVLDLSGFSERNIGGTGYELQRVIDTFPVERVVFLADARSNKRFLNDELNRAWSQMAAGSPNSGTRQRSLFVGITDRFRRNTTTQTTRGANGQVQSTTTTTHTDLVARRDESRRLAAYVQQTVYS